MILVYQKLLLFRCWCMVTIVAWGIKDVICSYHCIPFLNPCELLMRSFTKLFVSFMKVLGEQDGLSRL